MKSKHSYILALETVGNLCGIALYNYTNRSLVLEYCIHEKNMHDAMLAELVRRAIADTGISREELFAIAVSEGPGSFTGVRIGMSFAKGWCAVGDTHLISVPTFSALAETIQKHNSIPNNCTSLCIGMYSHADKVYVQHFSTAPINSQGNPELISIQDCSEAISNTTCVAGTIQHTVEHKGIACLSLFDYTKPSMIAEYAALMLDKGLIHNPLLADSQYHAEFIPTQPKRV